MSNPNKKISKSLTPARQLALRTLLSMQARGEKLQASLNETLGTAPKTVLPEDKALATELVYGCIRLKIRLDWILDQQFNKPDAVPLAMRRVMRMAVYELAYLSHIPSYATLNSYVDALKAGYGPKLAGLANAVLRKISQVPLHDESWFKQQLSGAPAAASPNAHANAAAQSSFASNKEFIRIWYSLPLWMVDHFLTNYPADVAEQYMAASIATPPLGLRLNKQDEHFLNLSQTLPQEAGFILQQDNALAFHSGFMPQNFGKMLAQGQMSRQSFAAQEVMQQVFNCLANEVNAALELGPIWDVCAGQGGKTCWMLENNLPVSASVDTSLQRLHGLAREIKRLHLNQQESLLEEVAPATSDASDTSGASEASQAPQLLQALQAAQSSQSPQSSQSSQLSENHAAFEGAPASTHCNLAIIAADASKPLPLKTQPGIVLVDAPCSGLGTLSRRPDIKIYREPADLAALVVLQKEIISTSFKQLAPGGLLIYLTCTLNPQENQEVIAHLQQAHKNAQQLFTWATPPNSIAKEFFWVSVIKKDA